MLPGPQSAKTLLVRQHGYDVTHSWTRLWGSRDASHNELSQHTFSYEAYLILDLLRDRKFSCTHFAEQYAKTVHIHLPARKQTTIERLRK